MSMLPKEPPPAVCAHCKQPFPVLKKFTGYYTSNIYQYENKFYCSIRCIDDEQAHIEPKQPTVH